ncbi:MAG: acetyl-CoA carboxylase carboxyltransferase subunit alpha [archaeon]
MGEGKMSAWEIVELARHKDRPRLEDYLNGLVWNSLELHGDRCFRDDPTIYTGWGTIGYEKFMIVGHRKGRDTNGKVLYNFGQAHPEGYRKALVKMKLAEKFGRPIVSFIDTPGAFPGIGAEERGQASAIAKNLMEMSMMKVPMISVIIGEGGSGGALGIMGWDRVCMLENSIYSVISPEGCAGILWRDGKKAREAAEALQLTAEKCLELGVVDGIIPEPREGAHLNYHETFVNVGKEVVRVYNELKKISADELVKRRHERLRNIGGKYIVS